MNSLVCGLKMLNVAKCVDCSLSGSAVFTLTYLSQHLEFHGNPCRRSVCDLESISVCFPAKGLGSIRAIFGLNMLEKLNTFVYLVLYLHNLNVITCF